MQVNFDKVIDKSIEQGVQMAHLASLGYVINNTDICVYYSNIVLNHMKNVYDELSDSQKEKVNEMYANIICL